MFTLIDLHTITGAVPGGSYTRTKLYTRKSGFLLALYAVQLRPAFGDITLI